MELVRRTGTFRDRLRTIGRDVGARDIECVAYVLGRTGGTDVPADKSSIANGNEGFEALAKGVMAAIDKEHAQSIQERGGEEGKEDGEEGGERRKRRRKNQ